MNQERTMPVPGEFYRHFKNRMYQIVAVACHSETGEQMVVYQALYGDYKVWVRPLSMFMGEVDHGKYPDVKQKYRFEKVMPDGREPIALGNVPDGESAPETEDTERMEDMSPYLLEFFDAMDVKNYDKMLEALAKLSGKATGKEVDDICMVLDIRPFGDTIPEQIAEIRRHILMLKKFDGERLR